MPGDTLGGFLMSGLGLLLLDASPAWASDVPGPRDEFNASSYQASPASSVEFSAPVWGSRPSAQSFPGTASGGGASDGQSAPGAAAPSLGASDDGPGDDGLARLLNFWDGFAPGHTSPTHPGSSGNEPTGPRGSGGPTGRGPSGIAPPAPASSPGPAGGAPITPLVLGPSSSPPPPLPNGPSGGSGGGEIGWSGGSFYLNWGAPNFQANPTITQPADQTSAEGNVVSLAISAHDPNSCAARMP
jgi:hypothetical protein